MFDKYTRLMYHNNLKVKCAQVICIELAQTIDQFTNICYDILEVMYKKNAKKFFFCFIILVEGCFLKHAKRQRKCFSIGGFAT